MKLFSESVPFYKGNLHMHTTLSDGSLSPDEAIALYRRNGYDFIALTDHNRSSAQLCCRGMLVLSGVELDVSLDDQCVHIVGVGVDPEGIQAAVLAEDAPPQALIDAVLGAGGRAILAHPAWSLNTVDLVRSLNGLSAAEVYNTFSGEPWNSERADSSQFLDLLATQGAMPRFVASDDAHRYTGEACVSYTMVQTPSLTREGILEALDSGAFYASQGPRFRQIEVTGDRIRVECSAVDRITFCSNRPWVRGRCLTGLDMTRAVYDIRRDGWAERFVRVVLTDRFGRRAWSNPIPV